MLRRAFMRLLGLAPVAAVAVPELAKAVATHPEKQLAIIPGEVIVGNWTVTRIKVYNADTWEPVAFTSTNCGGSIQINVQNAPTSGSAYFTAWVGEDA